MTERYERGGLDKELKDKNEQKRYYRAELEQYCLQWIQEVLEEQLADPKDAHVSLKDGQVLCRLINKIAPNTIKKINKMSAPFMQMENIAAFLNACKTIGVPYADLFSTIDLFEYKDMNQVIYCIDSLGRVCQKIAPYLPKLGVKLAEKSSPVQPKAEAGVVETLMERQQREIRYKQQEVEKAYRADAPKSVAANVANAFDAQKRDIGKQQDALNRQYQAGANSKDDSVDANGETLIERKMRELRLNQQGAKTTYP